MIPDLRLYFPSEGSHTQDFYALKNPSTPAGIEPANLGPSGEYDNHGTTGIETQEGSIALFLVIPYLPKGTVSEASIFLSSR